MMKFYKILLMILLSACTMLFTACSSTLPPEVIAALTKQETPNPDANTFVMKGDWQCQSPSKDCEIRVPLGGDSANASTERMRMLISYYNNQDTALDYFRAFTPFLSQGLSIWDSNRRDKRNNEFLLQQLESQTNEQIALYDMFNGITASTNESNALIANAGFNMFEQLAISNASSFESIYNANAETTASMFAFMPESGDVISNNYTYDYNDAFNQYTDSFNPATTTNNQQLQPIDWAGLTSFAGVFTPVLDPVVAEEVEP